MSNLLLERSISVACDFQPKTTKAAFERLPVLVASRSASLLQDAALTTLFHSFRVELFQSPFDLFVARAAPISYALLCASAGCPLLAAEAHIIRKQWPLAKIIVIGPAPYDLADHLYDDTVVTDCDATTLTTAFGNRSVDIRNRRVGWTTATGEPVRMPKESDPTKADPSDLVQPPLAEPRDLPADERKTLGRAVAFRSFHPSQALA